MDENKSSIKSPDGANIAEKPYMERPVQPMPEAPVVPCQKSSKAVLVVLLSILGILLVGGALALGYLWGNDNTKQSSSVSSSGNPLTNQQSNAEPNVDSQSIPGDQQSDDKKCSYPELTFSEEAIVNKQEGIAYSVDFRGSFYFKEGLAATAISHENKNVDVYIGWDALDSNFGTSKEGSNQVQAYKVNFDSSVTDVLAANFSSQAFGYETFLFLLEDGTVEYMPLQTIYKTREVKSSGKIAGLSDIRKLYQGSSMIANGTVGGNTTAFAQSTDGKIYQLYTILRDAGAWD